MLKLRLPSKKASMPLLVSGLVGIFALPFASILVIMPLYSCAGESSAATQGWACTHLDVFQWMPYLIWLLAGLAIAAIILGALGLSKGK